jgi:hypothetical protein
MSYRVFGRCDRRWVIVILVDVCLPSLLWLLLLLLLLLLLVFHHGGMTDEPLSLLEFFSRFNYQKTDGRQAALQKLVPEIADQSACRRFFVN